MKDAVFYQIFVYFFVSAAGICTRNGKSAVGDFHVEAAAAVVSVCARQNFALFFKRGLVVVGDGRDVGFLRRSERERALSRDTRRGRRKQREGRDDC